MSTIDHVSQLVITAFQDCFPEDAIDLESDFFELGGDSLALVSLCSALETKLAIDIAPSTLLYHPTAQELAEEITALIASG